MEVDVRAVTRDALVAVEAAIREACARTVIPDVTVDVVEEARHWPMEKLERSGRLVAHAAAIAEGLGFPLHDAATGGASDANTTAGMGVPTIDGLGPIGGLDHSPGEYLDVASIVPRTVLLAALITAIGRDPEVRAWRAERLASRADGATRQRGRRPVSRRHVSSGGPWEATAGYSRALAVGDACFVSGTTDAGPEGVSRHPGDAAGQARAVFAIIDGALAEAGFALDDVVRTRMFIVDPADAEAVIAVHGELFRDIRPASTLVVVARLIDPTLLVEIEADARKG